MPLAAKLASVQRKLLKDVSQGNKNCQVGGTLTSDTLSVTPGSCDRKASLNVREQKMT